MPNTKTVKVNLEQVWRPRKPSEVGVPLCVIDFRVALHGILSLSYEFASLQGIARDVTQADDGWGDYCAAIVANDLWADWVRASWAIKLNRGPDMLPRTSYRVIVVDDNKLDNQYWRSVVVDEYKSRAAAGDSSAETLAAVARHTNSEGNFVTYKGSRSAEDSRDSCYHSIKTIGHALVRELAFPFYSEPLYEADDWAGLIHRLKLRAFVESPESLLATRELYYSTVDSDWLQLVDDASRQYWANTGPWPSRLKNEAEARAYVLKRMGVRIDKPSEIALVKQQQGDTADDLPAGSDLSLFDLTKPNSEYDLALACLLETRQLIEDLSSPEANTKHTNLVKAVQWCCSKGLPVAAKP